jgi:hypothetical protein
MIMKRLQNRNIVPQALPGRQLAPDWQRNAKAIGAKADEDYRSKIENAWREPMSTKPVVDNIMRDSRLSK